MDIIDTPEANAFKMALVDALTRFGADGGSLAMFEFEEIAEYRFRQMLGADLSGAEAAWRKIVTGAYGQFPSDYFPPNGPEDWVPSELELAGMPFTTRSATILNASEAVVAVGVVAARTDREMCRLLAKQFPEAHGFGHHDGGDNVIPLRPSTKG